jgi:quercetin dioxygenase-like cupin family protein
VNPGRRIETLSEIPAYSPPGHSGTVNRRLVEAGDCGRFEMILGEIEPGGTAERHAHKVEFQAIYILAGAAEVALDGDPTRRCGPGTVVRIPPGLAHEVKSVGTEPLRLVVVYSPPLPARGDRPVTGAPTLSQGSSGTNH